MNPKKIVILDGYTVVRDDLNWNDFENLANISAFDRTPSELVIERAIDADIILTNKVLLTKEVLKKLPKLKYVGILATGFNNVDLSTARDLNIDVTNIPSYGTNSVAQSIFSHILNISNETEKHSQAVKNGDWCKSADICFCLTTQTELTNKTIGLIGYGAIGKKTAQIAKAFDMQVLAYTPRLIQGDSDQFANFTSLDEIFSTSDIIALCCPLTDQTREIINNKNIDKMKDDVWIINTGRGPLIKEDDLAEALKSGKVGAAGVDVLSIEPPTPDNPLLSAPNCHITPHNAWTTFQARKRLLKIAFDNLDSWIKGEKKNVVN